MIEVFYDPPENPEDDRQQAVSRVLGNIVNEIPGEEVAVIGMRGFRASAVDLGWLQGRIREYWFREQPDWDVAVGAIEEGLRDVVQRLKYFDISKTETHINVTVRTKDDHGWYAYEFDVYILKDLRPDGTPRLRVAESNPGKEEPS